MKKLKITAALLAFALLCGCGGLRTAETALPTTKVSGTTEDANDLSRITTGLNRDETIFTVDGEPVQAEQYLFWLARTIWDYTYYYGDLSTDEAWAAATETVKSDAMETAKMYRIIETKAAQYGVTLSAEQEAQIKSDLKENIDQMGGELELQSYLDEMCISREGFFTLNRLNYLYWELEAKLEEDGTIAVTDEELAQKVEENGIYGAKHILISTRRQLEDGSYEEYSDAEKAEALALAQSLYDQIVASGNDEAVFDQLMNQYSNDGRDADGNLYTPGGYTYVYSSKTTDSTLQQKLLYGQGMRMVTEFEEGALALEVGQVSEPVETTYGYHIILRIPVDMEQAREDFGPETKMGDLLDSWMAEAAVETTPTYDALDPQEFHTKLAAAYEERHPNKAAEGATEETAEPTPTAVG